MRWYYIEISTRMRFLSAVGTFLSLNIISSTLVNLLWPLGDQSLNFGWKLSSLAVHHFMMKFGANSSAVVDKWPIALRMRVRSLILAFWIAMTYLEIAMIQIEKGEGGLISESFSTQPFLQRKVTYSAVSIKRTGCNKRT